MATMICCNYTSSNAVAQTQLHGQVLVRVLERERVCVRIETVVLAMKAEYGWSGGRGCYSFMVVEGVVSS